MSASDESRTPEARSPNPAPVRSFVIPVLKLSRDSEFNIEALLRDLETIPGEVVCIFNSRVVFEELQRHTRIDKFCFNSHNVGVSRSWSIGFSVSEGRFVFFLNADLSVQGAAIDKLENYLASLDRAVMVGPQGTLIDFPRLVVLKYFDKGTVKAPLPTQDVSGFFFAVHRERFERNGLAFDTRFSPCFFEEWDLGLQALQAGLAVYTVPVTEYEHHWGVSCAPPDTVIPYFGRPLTRGEIFEANRKKFKEKWAHLVGYK